MKLSDLGQGKRKGKEYNYQGLRLLFGPPERTNFLAFSGGIAGPIAELKRTYDKYGESLKQEANKPKEELGPEFYDSVSAITKQSKASTEDFLVALKTILPETIIGWVGVTLEKYEEFFETEYSDIADKKQLMEFDPPEAAYDALYEKAKRDDAFRSWLSGTIMAIANQKEQEVESQKKTLSDSTLKAQTPAE